MRYRSITHFAFVGLALAALVRTAPSESWEDTTPYHLVHGATGPPAVSSTVRGVPICRANCSQRYPAIVSDGAGGAIIAWEDRRNQCELGNLDIYAQRILANGAVDPAWPVDGRALCTAQLNQTRPAIVSDGAGGAIVVWKDRRDVFGWEKSYAQHVLASGEVDPSWPENGREILTDRVNTVAPFIATDGNGGIIIFCNTVPQLRAHHVLAGGVLDPSWPAGGLLICDWNGPWLDSRRIVSDGTGGAIVTWGVNCADQTVFDVYAQHVLASGELDPDWPSDGRLLCTANDYQSPTAIESDGAGGAIVVWTDGRDRLLTGLDSYAQHVLATGAVDPDWPNNGTAISTATADQGPWTIASDGAGGAIVAWHDYRSGSQKIYTQRVLASGEVDWTPNGLFVCCPSGSQSEGQVFPAIASDNAGGIIICWVNEALYPDAVYVQRVLNSGVIDPAWPGGGRPVSDAFWYQREPAIVSDGAGGALVAWVDERNDPGDIYAQHIYGDGTVVAAENWENPATGRIQLLPSVPNPFTGATSISFWVPRPIDAAWLLVYDIAGHRVAYRALGALRNGPTSLVWDGHRREGSRLPAGVYLYRIEHAAGHSQTGRLVIVR